MENPNIQTINAPAKLNLNLHIIGTTEYHYHLIEGISVFTDFSDQIEIALLPHQLQDHLIVTGPFALQTPATSDNLVLKVLHLLRNISSFPFLEITLIKNIPAQAGYGGGSSDAAAIIKWANDYFKLNHSFETLKNLIAPLGADIPMCLYAKPCLIEGIGDHITPLETQNLRYPCILLKPNVHLSTQMIFKQLVNKHNPFMARKGDLFQTALKEGRNDLFDTACQIYLSLKDDLEALKATNPLKAAMSGSGSGFFALYDINQQDQYYQAYEDLKKIFPSYFIRKTFVNI